jgi:hypothetical protein
MKVLIPLLFLAALTGCSRAPKDLPVDQSGSFTLTNNTGVAYWENVQESKTNDLRFILLLPASEHFGSGSQGHGYANYNYCNLTTKRDGHQWKIEANEDLKTRAESLRLYDLTANTVVFINLAQSRWWQISDDRQLIPLDQIDPSITEKVSRESEAGFKNLQSFQAGLDPVGHPVAN